MYTAGDQELIRVFRNGSNFIEIYDDILTTQVFIDALRPVYQLSQNVIAGVEEDRELYSVANEFATKYMNIVYNNSVETQSTSTSKIDGKKFRFKMNASTFLIDYGFEKQSHYYVKGDEMVEIVDGDDEYIIRDALK